MAKVRLPPPAPPAAPPPEPAIPAGAPDLTRKGPPLRPGEVYRPASVTATAPAGMTQAEFDSLTAAGWSPGQQITPQVLEAARQAAADVAAGGPPPLDPSTPPASLDAALKAGTPAQRSKLAEEAKAAAATPVNPPPAVASFRPAPAVPPPPATTVNLRPGGEPQPPAKRLRFLDVPDDQAPQPSPPGPPPAPEPPPAPPESDAGAAAPAAHCPQCGWDLKRPTDPEPEYAEKMAYLATVVLGDGRPYTREFDLLGGRLRLTFRTLTTRETDAIYRQAAKDHRDGLINDAEVFEQIQRYRMYLSLRKARGDAAGTDRPGLDADLPDGLDPASAPNADAHWAPAGGAAEDLLRRVEDLVLRAVLNNESLTRLAYQACARFNREVARLEGAAANPDFWKATGSRP